MFGLKKYQHLIARRKRWQTPRKHHFFFVPHGVSLASALLGFFSILQCVDGNTMLAAYAIFYAVLLDAFDGRLARAIGTESLFGAQLDSLADAISFCLAPAVLLYSVHSNLNFAHILPLFLFVAAGIFRLARFNEFQICSGSQEVFIGLPTTLAAFFLVNLVLWMDTTRFAFSTLARMELLPVVAAMLAVLMVSKVVFPSFKNKVFGWRRVSKSGIMSLLFIFYVCQMHGVLLVCLTSYIIGSLAYACGGFAIRWRISKFYR